MHITKFVERQQEQRKTIFHIHPELQKIYFVECFICLCFIFSIVFTKNLKILKDSDYLISMFFDRLSFGIQLK
jgi:hypothetical protein